MRDRRVGREVPSRAYWQREGETYRSNLDGPYHTHRMEVVQRLAEPLELKSSACVDFGCGEGVVLGFLSGQGASVIGIDRDQGMCVAATERLVSGGLNADVRCGGVESLAEIEADSVDNLFAVNVIGYFSYEEEERFYREAGRIVRDEGSLVVMTGNELFDVYTLNSFTVAFYERHFRGVADRYLGIEPLLTHPSEPDRIRNNIYDNPLAYRYKLRRYGFEEVQQEFANLHPAPPLLMDPASFADIDQREYLSTLDWHESERWKLLFLCTMFGARAVRRLAS